VPDVNGRYKYVLINEIADLSISRPLSWIKESLLLREGDGKGVDGGEKKRTGGKG